MKKENLYLCEAAAMYFVGSITTCYAADKLAKKAIKNWLLEAAASSALATPLTYGWLIAAIMYYGVKLRSLQNTETSEKDSETA